MNDLRFFASTALVPLALGCNLNLATEIDSARPNLECAPPDPEWSSVAALYDTTEDSVHELVTCGGLQIRMSQQLLMMVVSSNEELLQDEERMFVEDWVPNPFTQDAEGRWTMEIPDSPTSSFALSFYDPTTDEFIAEDVFDMNSYLAGVHVQSSMTFSEMIANPSRENVFAYTYDGPGPLGHLMNGGEPLPESFELALSLEDMLYALDPFGLFSSDSASPADYGPFNSLLDVRIDSLVEYDDVRSGTSNDGDVTVTYTVSTSRDSVREVAANEALAFEVERITSSHSSLVADGDAADLRLVSQGTLAGEIRYTIQGELDAEVHILVTSDFGEGASYPEPLWACP
jgi:hypothetical protein